MEKKRIRGLEEQKGLNDHSRHKRSKRKESVDGNDKKSRQKSIISFHSILSPSIKEDEQHCMTMNDSDGLCLRDRHRMGKGRVLERERERASIKVLSVS